jgi:hypothetical protein
MKTMELGVCSTFFLEQIHGETLQLGVFGAENSEWSCFLSEAAWNPAKHTPVGSIAVSMRRSVVPPCADRSCLAASLRAGGSTSTPADKDGW